jgi:DNA-binding transcriptional regulator LsrR (DeoR family)
MSAMKRPSKQSKVDQLASVAVLKYKMGYSQAKIASMLGVSTMTISRMLDAAIDHGIVKISIKTSIDSDEELSQELIARFSLKDALIVKNSPYEDAITSVAKATAYYLDLSICPGDVLGIAAGRTLSQVMPYMTVPLIGRSKEQFEVVQLQGGYAAMGDRNPTNSIINFANRFGVKGHLLQHPMYVSSMELAKIIHEHEMASLEEMWKKCSILVSGVGTWGPHSIQREERLLSEKDFAELDQAHVVGDLFGRWFDAEGNYVDCSCNHRLVSIPPRVQKNIPKRILVSSGVERLQAIHVLLKHSMLNIFISDERTAKTLLDRA